MFPAQQYYKGAEKLKKYPPPTSSVRGSGMAFSICGGVTRGLWPGGEVSRWIPSGKATFLIPTFY